MAGPSSPPSDPIAIIGMAGRFPGAPDIGAYWLNLVNGVDSISRDSSDTHRRFDLEAGGTYIAAAGLLPDIDLFDAEHFRIPRAEALLMDPQHRILLELVATALDDAGYGGDLDSTVGVFVGCGPNHYFRENVAPQEVSDNGTVDVRVTLANEKDFLAPRIAFKFGFTGPSITVQTSCATALSATALACQSLAAGDCDIAVAGGVSLLMPDVRGYVHRRGGIGSSDGFCRTFDAGASGTVPGSGAGVVVLKRDGEARDDRDHRYATIRGWAVNNDGGSRAGFTVPNVSGQSAVIRRALGRAQTEPAAVGYVEAHGTGTPIGDPVEIEALRKIFTEGPFEPQACVLGAVKPSIGHTDAASGVAGLIKAALAVKTGIIPGTSNFATPIPGINDPWSPFRVTSETEPWRPDDRRIAGVSSFGLGGTNAHVVLEGVDDPISAVSERYLHVLVLSARSDQELTRLRTALADWLGSPPGAAVDLADVSYTLAVGRQEFAHRWSAVVADVAAAVSALRGPDGPPGSVTRWSLGVSATPSQLADASFVSEPLVRDELSFLTEALGPRARAHEHVGLLSSLSAARVLARMGIVFARVSAPPWARRAFQWFEEDHDTDQLALILAGSPPDPDDRGGDTGRSAKDRVGHVTIDEEFSLAQVAADAWAAGARVRWDVYFSREQRHRVSLPSRPFTRASYWMERPVPKSAGATHDDVEVDQSDGEDVLAVVRATWQEVLGLDSVEDGDHFVDDLNGDSLYAVEIGARLNERFGLQLPLDMPFVAPTVTDSAQLIAECREDGRVD